MNILIVDDAKAIQHIVSTLLREFGYSAIFTASNIDEAKNVLKAKTIELIFADIHMPGGSGLDLLKFVRSSPDTAKISFIIITSDQEKKNIFEAIKLGIQSYMIKPVQKPILFQKLNDLIKSNVIEAPISQLPSVD